MKNEASKRENKVKKGAMDELIKKHFVLAILTFVAVVIVSGTATYALFQIDKQNTTNQSIAVGNLSANITSQTGKIVLNDLFPKLSTELPEDYKYYEFTVLNDGDYDLKYEVYLKDATDTLLSSSTEYSLYKRIDTNYYKYINFILDDGEVQNLESVLQDGKFMLLSGTMEPGYSKSHKIKFFIDKGETTTEGAPNDLGGSILSLDIYLDAVGYDKDLEPTLVQTLLSKSNDVSITDYNSGNKGEMFTFTHPEAEQTTGWSEEERTDYRYIGANPNNYINFNDEIWRIIGVFTVEGENGEKEQRIKIISEKPTAIGVIARDSNTGESFTDIKTEYLNVIAKTKYYLGTYVNDTASEGTKIESAQDSFLTERSIPADENLNANFIKITGLLYPSDYLFSKDVNSNTWLTIIESSWLSTPERTSDALGHGYVLDGNEIRILYNHTADQFSVYPDEHAVLYLRADVESISGDGSQSAPYVLKI